MAQPPVQMVNMQPRPTAPSQPPIVAPTQGQAAQQQPQAPKNSLLQCIRFFACWECRPIGTIIAATAFATATVFTYQALKLAIWTATKDYIEHCQSVVVSDPQNFICYWDRIIDSSKGLGPSNYKMHSSS
ncbi:hypothetical protein BKA61DRAFT_607322 [Leptodontidium sp. MPI-SDFR-AT-0119]|nr:hypothetical protein BKA61DRAFT_607322 [Leptodontidium sp. MPI-SDFR-AT-0119]